jgi:glycosyltransferase involved in cell wall biosynthesis
MSNISHKEYVGPRPVWPGRICFIALSSGLGGTETLAIRQSRWLRRNGVRTAIITRAGVMEAEYRDAFDQVLHLDGNEVDPGSLLMDEWYRLINRLADELRSLGGWHFMVFGQDGIFISSELSARLAGSSTSIYLVDDVRYGPIRLDYVEAMSRHGLFFSMNEACLAAHRRNYGYKLDNAVVVPLPMTVAAGARASRASSRVKVLTVARLVPMKGYVEGLILVIARAVREDGLDIELQVVGAGPLMARLKWVALREGIASRVIFVGSVPYADLPPHYRDADIFVGMGTTVLEAASHGVPALIAEAYTMEFRSPGLFSEQGGFELGEPNHGAPSPAGDGLLRSMLKDGGLRAAEGEAGRRKMLSQFSEDVVMTRLLGELRANARQVINIPSPGQDRLCGETKRYLKRLLRGSGMATALRLRVRSIWDATRALISR